MLDMFQELSKMKRDIHRCVPWFYKYEQYKKTHCFTVVGLLYLDGFELNYSSMYKYNLEGVHILAPDSLETKAAIQINMTGNQKLTGQ